MSDLRDARMAKALDAAPDAQMRPSAQVRERIRSHAHEAVEPASEPGFWSKLWRGSGQRHMPWNAAFATIALATLVTVLWRDREPPAPEPVSAPPRIEQPAVDKQPVEKPAVESKRKASAVAAPASPIAPASPAAPAAADSVAKRPPVPPAREAQLEQREAISADRALRDKDARAMEKSAPAATESERRLPQPQAQVAPPAPPQAPLIAPAPAEPAAGLSSRSQFVAAQPATALRISSPQGSVEVPLQRPSPLADLLDRSIREARSTDALDASVDLRVDLLRQGEMLGTLELAGTQLRWTRAGAASGFTSRDPALLQTFRDELSRLPVR
jgi:hypothetical protein